MSNNKSSKKHKHGFWLTFWLVILFLSSLLTVALVLDQAKNPEGTEFPYLIAAIFIAAIAKIVGVVGIYFWQKWGLYLFMGGVILATIAGLMLTANWLLPLNEFLPLAILGWLIKDKWAYFGIE